MKPIYFQTALIVATLAAVAGGIFLLVRQSSPDGLEILLPTATAVPQMRVYISGAVRSPGVYPVIEGDRLGACLRIDQLTVLIGQDSPVATDPAWCGWTYPGRLSKTPLPMAWHDSLLFPVAPLPLTLPDIPAPKRNSFSRLWPAQMSSHSRFTFARSIRRAQRSRPRFVRSLRRIRSLTDSPLGMRPRCAGSNTLPWRVFSGAMNGFAPSA